MQTKFKVLECNDNDVLSFNDDKVFKFSKFKHQLIQGLNSRINTLLKVKYQHNHNTLSEINKFRHLGIEGLEFGAANIKINYSSPEEGIDCELLRLGAT